MDQPHTLAEIKADLAALGVSLKPSARIYPYTPPVGGSGRKGWDIVCLDRARDVPDPDYCVHGFTACVACREYVVLGSQTAKAVIEGGAVPMCLPCCRKHIPYDRDKSTRLVDH